MKRLLKIAIGVIWIFFVTGCDLPDTKNEQIKKEVASDKETIIELKSEWYTTEDSKKERLIEKRIDGE